MNLKIFYWDGHEWELDGKAYMGTGSPVKAGAKPVHLLARHGNGCAIVIAETKEQAIALLKDKFHELEDRYHYYDWQDTNIESIAPEVIDLQPFAFYQWGTE